MIVDEKFVELIINLTAADTALLALANPDDTPETPAADFEMTLTINGKTRIVNFIAKLVIEDQLFAN